MHLNTFKILSFTFLIFLSCYISYCRGKAVTDPEERNQTINSSLEFNSTVNEESNATLSVSQDPCEPNPCENGGSCTISSDFPENFTCECREEYIGDKCEIDQCFLLQCKDDEVCVIINGSPICDEVTETECNKQNPKCTEKGGSCSVNGDTLKCICPGKVTYNGDTGCENPCEPNPCKNDGLCKFDIDFPGNFTCECKKGYIGKTCGLLGGEDGCNKDKCISLPCNCCPGYSADYFAETCLKCNCGQPSTTNCTFHIDDIKVCHCETGYIKTINEGKCIEHPCNSNPCQNGGQCIVTEDKATCICKNDFTGDFCEIEKCKRFSCKIDGKCTIISGQAICDCAVKFRGNFCGTGECLLMNAQCKNGKQCPLKQVPCYCSESNFGKFCSIPVEYVNYLCDSNCKETGGFCVIVNNQTTKCMCPEGTEYRLDSGCTSLKNECPTFCEQTGGYCTLDGNSQIKCRCPSGTKFVGMIGCQEDLPQKQSNTIILSVVCVLLIVLAVGVFCLLCNRIRSMRK